MKRIIFSLFLTAISLMSFGQNGIEGLTVESSTNAYGTTYRFFVDMAPDYVFQAIYGDAFNNMVVRTDGQFYNATYGVTLAPDIRTRDYDGELEYDSWFTIGQIDQANIGVPVAEGGSIAGTVTGFTPTPTFETNVDPVFLDGSASGQELIVNGDAIGVTTPFAGSAATRSVLVAQITVSGGDIWVEFNVQVRNNANGRVEQYSALPYTGQAQYGYQAADLAWSSYVAPNDLPVVTLANPGNQQLNNVVTISATATDSDGSVSSVNFLVGADVVAATNVGGDVWEASYTFDQLGAISVSAEAFDNVGGRGVSAVSTVNVTNAAPVVSINSPDNNASFSIADGDVTIDIASSDADGVAPSVVVRVDGAQVGTGTGNFTLTWNPTVGNHVITAVATDEDGAVTNATAVNFNVFDPAGSPYTLGGDVVVPCYSSDRFCVPFIRDRNDLAGVTGFDAIIHFDANYVTPTRVIIPSEDLGVDRDYTEATVRVAGDSMFIAFALNSDAPAGTFFEGLGQVYCVEFARNINFVPGTTVNFEMTNIVESYEQSYVVQADAAYAGSYTTVVDSIFDADLKFWADNSPISGTSADGYAYTGFGWGTGPAHRVEPDVNGHVMYNFLADSGHTNVTIDKDIENRNDYNGMTILSMFGGQDALMVAKVLVDDPMFTPDVFQIIAMDVNLDGRVTAGDLSQINQRGVQTRTFWSQANMANGNPQERDWKWLSASALYSQAQYRISASWPANDGMGYSKYNVPSVSNNYVINTGFDANCPVTEDETFFGILLGDVDGSYKNLAVSGAAVPVSQRLKAAAESSVALLDLSNAVIGENYIDVPVKLSANQSVNNFDFNIEFNSAKLQFATLINHDDNVKVTSNNGSNDQVTVLSYVLSGGYNLADALFTLRFAKLGDVTESDFTFAAQINSNLIETEIAPLKGTTSVEELAASFKLYPNPANNVLNIESAENVTITIMTIDGKTVEVINNVHGETSINVDSYAAGMYLVKVSGESATFTRNVVIK